MVDLYGFHVGKYTVRPMDGMGLVIPGCAASFSKTFQTLAYEGRHFRKEAFRWKPDSLVNESLNLSWNTHEIVAYLEDPGYLYGGFRK